LGIWAMATAHAVMVGVMALTPVHMQDHGSVLKVIGLTISIHIAGMFALSPVMGWISDAAGPLPTIVGGQAVLLAAVGFAGTSGHSEVRITIGLALLGIGWSASVIAGASLVAKSAAADVRPLVQGLADLSMHIAGASGGLLAGIIVATRGYGVLNAAAGAVTVPLIIVLVMTMQRSKVVEPAR
jgi:MFS family permease